MVAVGDGSCCVVCVGCVVEKVAFGGDVADLVAHRFGVVFICEIIVGIKGGDFSSTVGFWKIDCFKQSGVDLFLFGMGKAVGDVVLGLSKVVLCEVVGLKVNKYGFGEGKGVLGIGDDLEIGSFFGKSILGCDGSSYEQVA